MKSRVAHFEIHAGDPEMSIKFYTDVFGWTITKWEGGDFEYWMVMTGERGAPDGINGGLLRRKGPAPMDGAAVNAFVCTVIVPSYDECHEKILAAGGTVAVPKAALKGMAWQGYYKDTDGNLFGIHQPDEKAM